MPIVQPGAIDTYTGGPNTQDLLSSFGKFPDLNDTTPTPKQLDFYGSLTAGDNAAGKPLPVKSRNSRSDVQDNAARVFNQAAQCNTVVACEAVGEQLGSLSNIFANGYSAATNAGDDASAMTYLQMSNDDRRASQLAMSRASSLAQLTPAAFTGPGWKTSPDPIPYLNLPTIDSSYAAGTYRSSTAFGNPLVAYTPPAAVSPWGDFLVTNDAGTVNYRENVNRNNERNFNIATSALGLGGKAFSLINDFSDLWNATNGANSVSNASAGELALGAAATRPLNTTRSSVTRTNPADWRSLRDHWNDLGYGEILSEENLSAIAKGRTPKVDNAWVSVFPEDAGLMGEKISMHHIGSTPVTVPLAATRHLNAHMPGGFRYNVGGPESALPFYPPTPNP